LDRKVVVIEPDDQETYDVVLAPDGRIVKWEKKGGDKAESKN